MEAANRSTAAEVKKRAVLSNLQHRIQFPNFSVLLLSIKAKTNELLAICRSFQNYKMVSNISSMKTGSSTPYDFFFKKNKKIIYIRMMIWKNSGIKRNVSMFIWLSAQLPIIST